MASNNVFLHYTGRLDHTNGEQTQRQDLNRLILTTKKIPTTRPRHRDLNAEEPSTVCRMLLPLKEVQLTTAPSTTSNKGTERAGEQGSSDASMSRYWAGDDAWTNPPLQALPRRREGSGGGLEYGSGAFDVTSQSWSYLTASDTLDGFFDPSHVQADVPTSVRNVPPTESHTLLHQTPNSAPVSIDQHILNQLGPNELADSGTIW
ncbi:hypothetical protein B0H13DRAFT_2385696 [Mycena leptocephala]|nr:hypothetical protein B0H13DRAFT_2385696 [Mycena leptocephala]